MHHKVLAAALSAGALICALTGCDVSGSSEGLLSSTTTTEPVLESVLEPVLETVNAFRFEKGTVVKTAQRFLSADSLLTLEAPEGAVIRYTLDGSLPTKDSAQYTEPIEVKQQISDFPVCVLLRAKAFFADGTESETLTQTFFCAADIATQFRIPVVSIAGDPAEITDQPDGIFYGKNAHKRGRDAERGVFIEMLDPKSGDAVFAQGAGLRVYGAASRDASIKSMKLFARKSYDEANGKFSYDGFGAADAEGETIGKYDKLVLRNTGNDFQFAFIRDELFQSLAAQAGYTDVEAVKPVVVYLNGKYYGQHWLHESICDDLLKKKYGGKDGAYMILEGSEKKKNEPEDDPETAMAALNFNDRYAELSTLDLTDEEAYASVCSFLDVKNYLQYFAFNICINNNDWPQNNQKCYRYFAAEGEEYSTDADSRLDGRWRFYFHDMDYSAGLYGQDETQAVYNNLAQILKEDSPRYAPLFAHLMAREDCGTFFRTEVTRLMEGVLSEKSICDMLDTLNAARYQEMRRYFSHLEKLKKTDQSIWIWYEEYQNQTKMIRAFAKERPAQMLAFLL